MGYFIAIGWSVRSVVSGRSLKCLLHRIVAASWDCAARGHRAAVLYRKQSCEM